MYSLLGGAEPRRLAAIASATGASGITYTALRSLELLGASVPADLLAALANDSPGCRIGSGLLADHRWLFGNRRPAFGAISVIAPLYVADATFRRTYRREWPRRVYDDRRRRGDSPLGASMQVGRGALSLLMCGVALRLLAAAPTPVAARARLRDLLWREN